MSRTIIIILAVLALAALGAAYYFLVYLPGQTDTGPSDGTPCTIDSLGVSRGTQTPGTYQNGICVPNGVPSTQTNRMSAIQANNIVNSNAVKDSAGYPTIKYINSDFYKPDLSTFPQAQLQSMLKNGWWFGLLNSTSPGAFQFGDNGNFLVAIYDVRNSSSTVNSGKSQVSIPASLSPYLIV